LNSLKIINSDQITERSVSDFIPRTETELDSIRETVTEIINEVKDKGDNALIKFTKKYDNVELNTSEIKVTNQEIEKAYDLIDQDLLDALKTAKQNLIKFHEAQLKKDWFINIAKGVRAGQVYRPLETVGIYIPGGRAIYPSTVLMTATPAFIAGVKRIVLCSPPQKDGKIAPEILVAANEFGIKEIFKVGGAQAIAAMAYGTDNIPKVQKVIGPGSKWINVAKQLLSNIIAIDTPAGPSEILIIADNLANTDYIIADLISQIEHDPDNIGIVVSDSIEILSEINTKLFPYIEKCERKGIIKEALNNSVLIKSKNLDDSVRISNLIAPEHLEILIKNPKEIIPDINNAGAIFIGPYSPVPLGDYSAGTNHVLPTGGNAKKYSGLNVLEFMKIIDVLECNEDGLKILSSSATTIAEFEGLFAHKKAIEERLKDKN